MSPKPKLYLVRSPLSLDMSGLIFLVFVNLFILQIFSGQIWEMIFFYFLGITKLFSLKCIEIFFYHIWIYLGYIMILMLSLLFIRYAIPNIDK